MAVGYEVAGRSNTPQPHGYGQEWDKAGIEADWPPPTPDRMNMVTVLWPVSDPRRFVSRAFPGASPKSDIMLSTMTSLPRTPCRALRMLSSISSIRPRCWEKPCAINASLGALLRFHTAVISSRNTSQPHHRATWTSAGCPPPGMWVLFIRFHVGTTTTAGDTSFFRSNTTAGSRQLIASDLRGYSVISTTYLSRSEPIKVTPDFSFRGRTAFRNIQNTSTGQPESGQWR